MNEIFYTINETCNIFKVSRVTLWKWKKEGVIKPIRIGKSIRYIKKDIDKLKTNEAK